MTNTQNDAELIEAFAILTKPLVGRMREEVFVRDFLPFISPAPLPKEDVEHLIGLMDRNGDRKHNELDLRTHVIHRWLNEVGSPYNECNVYNSSEELIFTVPALFTRNELMSVDDAYRLPMLVEQAALRSRVLEKMGENFVKTEIEPLFYPPEVPEEFISRWNTIFKHYGLPLFGHGNVALETTENQDVDDDEDYDQVFDYD